MDKEINRQIDELNNLWHRILLTSNYSDLEKKYPRLKVLSENEIAIIRIISEGDEVIIKDIVDVLKIPKSTLTSMIDRLEKKNLIKRAISTKDRRSYKLELTEEGRKTQVEHDKFETEFYARIINSLDTYEEMENSAFPEKARRLGESIK